MRSKEEFLQFVSGSVNDGTFVKMVLSKPRPGNKSLTNVHIKAIELKGQEKLSFIYHYLTRDETKNYSVEEGLQYVNEHTDKSFFICNVFTSNRLLTLTYTKRNKLKITNVKQTTAEVVDTEHDRVKKKYVSQKAEYLKLLGITDQKGNVIPKMASKFKQINKYLEIVESLMKGKKWNEPLNIIDMGSGKGYLTFALYDYLNNEFGLSANIIGVELKKDLVDQCNEMAEKCSFDNLIFACDTIQSFSKTVTSIDILIALHACDTATDDAIYSGMASKADLIICAPCCHKQIRQQVKGKKHDNPLMKHGIFQERELEMVTDTLRSLIMEQHQYKTRIFEFVSNEHTRKNVMLVGSKSDGEKQTEFIQKDIDQIKSSYQIDSHYLEQLIG